MTTPYLDRHNDHLQIYVKRDNGGYLLTDGGEVISDLSASGCDLETPKRQALLRLTLNGFGVQHREDMLSVKADPKNFPLKKHSLVQAMLAINDLFFLAAPMVASLFLEDVTSWLELHEIRQTPRVKFTGKSGFDHNFDFVVPASRTAPERLLRVISRPNRDIAEALAFAWIDTREVRDPRSRFYAFLNDTERDVPAAVIEALSSYEIIPVKWGERNLVEREFAA